MKKRAFGLRIGESVGEVQVRPPSVEVDSLIPLPARASIQSEPSFRSTIMCSSKSVPGKVTPPRRVQVLPWSEEA